MATVQLVAVRPTVATVQVGDDPPSEITWSLLHAAQDQADDVGYVYRWLLHEFCRCEYLHRLGQAWHSPRRDVVEIIAELQAEDTRKSAEAESARK